MIEKVLAAGASPMWTALAVGAVIGMAFQGMLMFVAYAFDERNSKIRPGGTREQ